MNPLDDIATARDMVDALAKESGTLVSRPGDYAEDMGSHVAIRREDGTLILSLSHAEYERQHYETVRQVCGHLLRADVEHTLKASPKRPWSNGCLLCGTEDEKHSATCEAMLGGVRTQIAEAADAPLPQLQSVPVARGACLCGAKFDGFGWRRTGAVLAGGPLLCSACAGVP